MKRTSAAALALLLLAGASAQAQDKKDADRIGKDKAPVVLKKALAEVQKKKSAAISEASEMATGRQKLTQNYDGVLKKDFAAAKGGAEVYAKGATILVNTGGRFDPPDQVQGQEAMGAQAFKNPSILIDEAGKVATLPQFGPDEMVDGKDCKSIDMTADPVLLRAQLKEFGERLNRTFSNQIGFAGAQVFDLRNAMDEKGSAATYHVCVGKDDLLVYRIQWVIRPKIKPGSLPPMVRLPDDMDQKIDVKFSKWDEDVAFDIPGVVKAKLGIK
ncbi:MAG TPA: hypothetical protein VE981_03185 [Planctomycetota bacterium]|nr:hypothetical protein [Planctomycetota bacterium]